MHSTLRQENVKFKEIPHTDLYLSHEFEGNARKLADETYMAFVSVTFINRMGNEYKKHNVWSKYQFKTRQEAFRAAKLAVNAYMEMDMNGFPDSSISYEKNKRYYKS